MTSTTTAIVILTILCVLIGGVLFILLRKTKFKFTGFILVGFAAFFAYSEFLPHIYILDDDVENRYQEYIALYPSSFTFKSGETVEVTTGGKAIIINNNGGKRVFRIDYYSTGRAPAPRSRWLQPYTITAADHKVHHVYEDSPDTVRIKGNSTSRGVIADPR